MSLNLVGRKVIMREDSYYLGEDPKVVEGKIKSVSIEVELKNGQVVTVPSRKLFFRKKRVDPKFFSRR